MYLRFPCIPVDRWRRCPTVLLVLCVLLFVLCSCGGGSGTLILTNGQPTLASSQTLALPLIGETDVRTLDPSSQLDASGRLVMGMFYSGLVRLDKDFHILPDQANWDISNAGTTYTFHVKPGVTFADGMPVTAQTYIASWTRALTPHRASSRANQINYTTPQPYTLALPIVGARELHDGTAQTLSGVQAVDDQTLRVTLTQPTPTFLQSLAQPFFFPVNQELVTGYAQQDWPVSLAKQGIGTGPFVVQEWDRDIKMVLIPNPHYYGPKLTLTQLTVYFMNDARVSYTQNRAGRFDLTWDMVQTDQQAASMLHNYEAATALQTDALFYNTTEAPFNSVKLRQAFAAALDKQKLAQVTMKGYVRSAESLFPPAMPGYEVDANGNPIDKLTKEPISYDSDKAHQLLKSATNGKVLPTITFTYPQSELTPDVALAMQTMWQKSLGIHVNLQPLEDDAYQHEMSSNSIQFGLYTWHALLNDPSDFAQRLLSTSEQNVGQWHNEDYDRTVAQAAAASGQERLQLYHKAEQIALSDAAIVPITHAVNYALVSTYVQGIDINAAGLSVGDWSQLKVLNHHP
jgi:oligopeptide transport system substrate-binding protein